MNEKEKAFIKFLHEMNDWVKASILSTHFSVSTRTIRNYVTAINLKTEPDELITSSQHGYKIDNAVYYKIKTSSIATTKHETSQDRLHYIIEKSIINSAGIDIFDISEELYVSVSTIESDITKGKLLLDKFNLSFNRTGDLIILNGLEINKRKLMSHIFYEESNDQFLRLEKIQEAFGYNLKTFKRKLIFILSKYNLNINEYTVGNILLHIIIATDRIKNNNTIKQNSVKPLHNKNEYNATIEIAELIKDEFGVIFDESELYYLTIILISKTTLLDYDRLKKDNLNEYIENRYIRLVDHIIRKVNEYYLVDLYDEDFSVKFTIHIRNLINRAQHNYLSKNPLTYQIKATYPLIYDLAVFISNEIQKNEQIVINEDEIAYIAFHIGAFLERKKELAQKMTCTVICPKYYNMHIEITKRLEETFGESIEIHNVITRIDEIELKQLKSDIIITTIDLFKIKQLKVIQISPFLAEDDIEKVHQAILMFKQNKKRNKLRKHLIKLFNPQLFQRNIYLKNEFEMIKDIGEKMAKLGFINERHIEDIIQREKMSSTAFNNNVAVPHSIHMNALKSSISIILNDKPSQWGNHTVQIIALIAINKSERKLFRDVYDSFIKIISEPKNVHLLLQSKNYHTFIESLLLLMENDL